MVLYLNITTHIEGRKDDTLLAEKGGRGFPYIAWMDSEGEVLLQQGDRSVDGFAASAKKLNRWTELKKKAESGDETAQIDLAILEGDLGLIDSEELADALEGKKLSDEQKAQYEAVKVNITVREAVEIVQAGRASPDSLDAVGPDLVKLHEAGKLPTDKMQRAYMYDLLIRYGQHKKDAKLMGAAIEKMAKVAEGLVNDRYLNHWRNQLKQLEAK